MTEDNKNGDIRLVLSPLPFAALRRESKIAAGKSIAEILNEAKITEEISKGAFVYINDEKIPQESWTAVKPKSGTTLTVRTQMQGGGGGGKNPLRSIISLALIAAAPQLSGALMGALNIPAGFSVLGVSASRLFSSGLSLIGRLALGAIAPPGAPKFSARRESPTLFIQGARNDLAPFARVPQVLGTHRMVPPLGARPFSETLGSDQYIRMLFIWGYGPLRITDLKIGETPLSDFEDVEIQTITGEEGEAPLTLYGSSVLQNDLQIALTYVGGYQTRTTEKDADEISVDITLPRGLVGFDVNGKKLTRTVKLEIQYSPAGLGQWSAGATGYKTIAAKTAVLSVRPNAYVINNTATRVTRIDRLVLDPASGGVTLIKGATFRNQLDRGSPLPPAIPSGMLALAKIERRSDDPAVIPPARITDERNLALAGSALQTSGDFLTTAHANADTISIAAGGLQFSGIEISARQTAALRKSVKFKVPRGQYDVRLRRLTADSASDDILDETMLTALRTHRNENPVLMSGLAMTALRIRATDQLNGVIDRFNGVVSSILPDWTGSNWVPQVTSNPASLFRHVLQGSANARPLSDARLDLAKIEGWHDACSAANREFNGIIDYDVSVRQVLADIAASGRASPAIIDGKWGIIEDKEQTVPVQHFTPRNTFGFKGEKAFDDLPHALRIRFLNRDKGWLEDERLVFDDGYFEENATKFEGIELPGITHQDQIWKDGRYHIATARLRPEIFSFMTDIEHIVCTRGDLIRFTHDVPLLGLASARVKSIATAGSDAISVTLDAKVAMEAGKSYSIRFRKSDGSSSLRALTTLEGSAETLFFSAPFSASEAPEPDDLAIFGQTGTESIELVIKAIEPQGDLSAKLTCIAAAPAVHQAESGEIPAFESGITLPPEMMRPPAPEITQIQSGAEAIIRNADGSISSRIIVTLKPPAFPDALDVKVQIRAFGESRFYPASALTETAQRIVISGIEGGETYDLLLFYVTKSDVLSPSTQITGHFVEGASAPPEDVDSLSLRSYGNTVHLSWPPVRDIDLDHYKIRFSPSTSGALWGNSAGLIERVPASATTITTPAANGTYLIKAIDAGGRESINAASAVSNVAGNAAFHTYAYLDVNPATSGTLDRLIVDGGFLRLTGADSIDDWDDIDAVLNTDTGNAGLAPSGTYEYPEPFDMGGVFTMTATSLIEVTGIDTNSTIDGLENMDDAENFDGGIDASKWGVQMEIRTTNDDPFASPTWSNWTPFVIGDYTVRGFSLRLVLSSRSSGITPAVSFLNGRIDIANRSLSDSGLTASAGGQNVIFSEAFFDVPSLSVTPKNMQSGDYYALSGITASGFHIQFYNSSASGVSRQFDYTANGYGRQIP